MKTFYLVALLALASCDAQQGTTTPRAQGPTSEEQPSQAGDAPQSEGPVETIPSDKEPETAKLTADNCVDPDLSKLAEGEKLMLCDGSIGVGSYVPPVTIPQPDLANLVATNIKSGITINGVTGTFSGLPQPDLSNLVADNVKHGVAINGVTGTYTGATIPSDCSTNGQVNCVTTFTYKAADLTNLTAANVKKGASVAGVVGDYPSTQNPLTGNSNVADLDAATFFAKIKTDAAFEWFDAQGVRHEATGSSLIAAENVKAGVSFLNITGSLAIDTVNPWDVKAGVTVNGVAGKIPVKCLPGNCGDGSNWVDLSPGGCEAYAAQNGQCTYKELTTGLTWRGTRNSAQYFSTWATAASDCASDGTGWRLPTVNELHQARLLKMKLGVSQSFNNKNNYHWASTAGNLTANEPGHFRVNMDPTGEINFSSHGGTTNLVKNDTNPEAETLLAVGICVKGP